MFGGGAAYCNGCRDIGSACARGGRGADGRVCPQVEHAPRTGLGQLAWDAAQSPGVWKAGGMGGVTGLDWAAARAMSDGEAWDALVPLLRAIEVGALRGAARKATQDKPGGGDHG